MIPPAKDKQIMASHRRMIDRLESLSGQAGLVLSDDQNLRVVSNPATVLLTGLPCLQIIGEVNCYRGVDSRLKLEIKVQRGLVKMLERLSFPKLTPQECRQVHETSMEILGSRGVRLELPEAINLLTSNGAGFSRVEPLWLTALPLELSTSSRPIGLKSGRKRRKGNCRISWGLQKGRLNGTFTDNQPIH